MPYMGKWDKVLKPWSQNDYDLIAGGYIVVYNFRIVGAVPFLLTMHTATEVTAHKAVVVEYVKNCILSRPVLVCNRAETYEVCEAILTPPLIMKEIRCRRVIFYCVGEYHDGKDFVFPVSRNEYLGWEFVPSVAKVITFEIPDPEYQQVQCLPEVPGHGSDSFGVVERLGAFNKIVGVILGKLKYGDFHFDRHWMYNRIDSANEVVGIINDLLCGDLLMTLKLDEGSKDDLVQIIPGKVRCLMWVFSGFTYGRTLCGEAYVDHNPKVTLRLKMIYRAYCPKCYLRDRFQFRTGICDDVTDDCLASEWLRDKPRIKGSKLYGECTAMSSLSIVALLVSNFNLEGVRRMFSFKFKSP